MRDGLRLALTTVTIAPLPGGRIDPATAPAGIALRAGGLAPAAGCLRGFPPAGPEGLGALVAGTVRMPELVIGGLAVAAIAAAAGPVRGPLAVLAGLAAALLLLGHARRRLGGITGDVLGALVEVAQTVTLVVLVLR